MCIRDRLRSGACGTTNVPFSDAWGTANVRVPVPLTCASQVRRMVTHGVVHASLLPFLWPTAHVEVGSYALPMPCPLGLCWYLGCGTEIGYAATSDVVAAYKAVLRQAMLLPGVGGRGGCAARHARSLPHS
eukprot:3392384-Rhodomonas_salina.1